MNTQSPLIPEGSILEQKNKGRARVKIAVFFVLAVHAIGLLALLMQGCRREEPEAQNQATNAIPPQMEAPTNVDTSLPIPTNVTSVVETNLGTTAVATDYTIVTGDTLSGIATKFHVTVKALTAANPGIEPTRLHPGQKIHIPAPTAAAPAAAPGATTQSDSGEKVYSVKSGDTLTTIAKQFNTTVKAIRSANNLKTDSIKVGQKLKSPAGATTPPAAAPPSQ